MAKKPNPFAKKGEEEEAVMPKGMKKAMPKAMAKGMKKGKKY